MANKEGSKIHVEQINPIAPPAIRRELSRCCTKPILAITAGCLSIIGMLLGFSITVHADDLQQREERIRRDQIEQYEKYMRERNEAERQQRQENDLIQGLIRRQQEQARSDTLVSCEDRRITQHIYGQYQEHLVKYSFRSNTIILKPKYELNSKPANIFKNRRELGRNMQAKSIDCVLDVDYESMPEQRVYQLAKGTPEIFCRQIRYKIVYKDIHDLSNIDLTYGCYTPTP